MDSKGTKIESTRNREGEMYFSMVMKVVIEVNRSFIFLWQKVEKGGEWMPLLHNGLKISRIGMVRAGCFTWCPITIQTEYR